MSNNDTGNRPKFKILVAEDEKAISSALELKLAFSGFEPVCAFDGEEALNMVLKNHFDLILLDLMMPKLDGFQVLEEIKKQNIKTQVVVLSNLGQEEDMTKAEALGAKAYFVKSNTPIADIVDYVKKILETNE
jgi:DNA-binding response OmpR family regulator